MSFSLIAAANGVAYTSNNSFFPILIVAQLIPPSDAPYPTQCFAKAAHLEV